MSVPPARPTPREPSLARTRRPTIAPSVEAGKMRAEGKSYTVKDGDVLHFLFNT